MSQETLTCFSQETFARSLLGINSLRMFCRAETVKALLVTIIVTMLIGLCVAPEATANFSPGYPTVGIMSPNGQDLYSSSVSSKIQVEVVFDPLNSSENRWIGYSLDGQDIVTLTPKYQGVTHPTNDDDWPSRRLLLKHNYLVYAMAIIP